jgi:replicative DNA helicase
LDVKVPPNSLEAEQSVLGGLMLNQNAWEVVSGILVSEDFYRPDHAIIFNAMAELAQRDKAIDFLTVSEKIKANATIDHQNIYTYLGQIAKNTPSSANISYYAEIVKECSVLRQLINIGTQICELGYTPNGRAISE